MPDSTQNIIYLKNTEKQLSEIKSILLQNNEEKKSFGIKEDYWTHFILPIAIPLFLSLLAFSLGKLYEKRKKLNSLKDKERFLFSWIALIQSPINKQVQSFKNFADKLQEMKEGELHLDITNIHIDKLKIIDSPTLVSLYVTNRKSDEKIKNLLLFKFEDTVDLIKRKDESTKNFINDIKQITQEVDSIWNEHYLKLDNTIKELHDVHDSLSNSEEIEKILILFADFTLTGKKGMLACMEHFVVKAVPICSTYINNYPKDLIMRKLMSSLQMLRHAYDSKKYHFSSYANIFLLSSESLINSYQILESIKEDLMKLKYKNTFFIK